MISIFSTSISTILNWLVWIIYPKYVHMDASKPSSEAWIHHHNPNLLLIQYYSYIFTFLRNEVFTCSTVFGMTNQSFQCQTNVWDAVLFRLSKSDNYHHCLIPDNEITTRTCTCTCKGNETYELDTLLCKFIHQTQN